ncbi:MAG: class I SAM-dependent rRNA methyltransferase [Calditrichia bacterium]
MSFENPDARAILSKGREKSVLNRHPWIFSRGIDAVEGDPEAGSIISVYSKRNDFLGKAFFNPNSQIRLRMLSFNTSVIDLEYLKNTLVQANSFRQKNLPANTNAYRVVNSENDLLPGLIIDRYNDVLVIQCNTLGISLLKPHIVEILEEMFSPAVILERSDSTQGAREGMQPTRSTLVGNIPEQLMIQENGIAFEIDPVEGQKTGFFLDQRDNRQRLANFCNDKNNVLNCFAFTGGFNVYAALKGATTTSVELSKPAVEMNKRNMIHNKIDPKKHTFICDNVFEYLRKAEKNTFDRIVLDPPAFAKQRKQVQKAARGYKDINRLAIEQIKPGGILLTCSCSAAVDADLFQKIVYSAAQEANRAVQIIGRPTQPLDHPTSIFFPEGEYLKTLILRVED